MLFVEKGQGSSEYLMVLGAVLLVSLVVVAILGLTPGNVPATSEAESTVYWRQVAAPLRVLEATRTPSAVCSAGANLMGYALVIGNNEADNIDLVGVSINGANRTFCLPGADPAGSIQIGASKKKLVNVEYSLSCAPGSMLELDVAFTYDRAYFSGRLQNGTKKLVLRCTDLGMPLGIITDSLTAASEGQAYSMAVRASGGIRPYSWSMGGLPAGLTYNSGTGVISGTPSEGSAGSYPVAITVADSSLPSQNASKVLLLTVSSSASCGAPTGLPMYFSYVGIPDGVVGQAYPGSVVNAEGGTPPYNITITGESGPLPSGLADNPPTGNITGVPAPGSNGTYGLYVNVTDCAGANFSLPSWINIYNPLIITTAFLPDAFVGAPYNTTLNASGGLTPYRWGASGLPSGLIINRNTGKINGTPSGSAGIYPILISVNDSADPIQQAGTTLDMNVS